MSEDGLELIREIAERALDIETRRSAISDLVPFHCGNSCSWPESEFDECPQRHWCPWCGDCEYCYGIGPHEWD